MRRVLGARSHARAPQVSSSRIGVSLRRPILPPNRLECGGAEVAAVAEGEAASAAQAIGVLRLLAMPGRDHEAILVIGDREIAVHLLDLRDA